MKQLDDFLKNFFELELYPGINGDGIVNVTKDMHEKNFRFKKGSKGYVSLHTALGSSVSGYIGSLGGLCEAV